MAAVEALEDGPRHERRDEMHRDGDLDDDLDDDLDGRLAFRRLDLLLAAGVDGARSRYGPEAAGDSYRGLYLTEEQVQRALRRRVGEPLVAGHSASALPSWQRIAADNAQVGVAAGAL